MVTEIWWNSLGRCRTLCDSFQSIFLWIIIWYFIIITLVTTLWFCLTIERTALNPISTICPENPTTSCVDVATLSKKWATACCSARERSRYGEMVFRVDGVISSLGIHVRYINRFYVLFMLDGFLNAFGFKYGIATWNVILFEWPLPVHCELLRLMTNSLSAQMSTGHQSWGQLGRLIAVKSEVSSFWMHHNRYNTKY